MGKKTQKLDFGRREPPRNRRLFSSRYQIRQKQNKTNQNKNKQKNLKKREKKKNIYNIQ